MTDENYLPIPVNEAARIGEKFEKNQIIILGYDYKYNEVHVTTWGKSSDEKIAAAHAGDLFAKMITGSDYKKRFEDFRIEEKRKQRQIAKDNIEYAIIQCGGNTKNLNLDGLLDRLGF